MKTKLPDKITTWNEAKSFLKSLHDNGESYHPEDDAFDIDWATASPTEQESERLNELMNEIYSLPEMKDYPNVEQCPCGFLCDLDKISNEVQFINPEDGEEHVRYKITNYNEVTERCYIEPISTTLSIAPQQLVSIKDLMIAE